MPLYARLAAFFVRRSKELNDANRQTRARVVDAPDSMPL